MLATSTMQRDANSSPLTSLSIPESPVISRPALTRLEFMSAEYQMNRGIKSCIGRRK